MRYPAEYVPPAVDTGRRRSSAHRVSYRFESLLIFHPFLLYVLYLIFHPSLTFLFNVRCSDLLFFIGYAIYVIISDTPPPATCDQLQRCRIEIEDIFFYFILLGTIFISRKRPREGRGVGFSKKMDAVYRPGAVFFNVDCNEQVFCSTVNPEKNLAQIRLVVEKNAKTTHFNYETMTSPSRRLEGYSNYQLKFRVVTSWKSPGFSLLSWKVFEFCL